MHVIVRRLIQLIVVLIVVTFFTSILTALLPGDPVTTIAPFSSAQDRAEIRNQLEPEREHRRALRQVARPLRHRRHGP